MISGGLVTLRPWQQGDTSFVYDACQDAELQRWTRVPRPYTALDAASFVDRHARPQPEDDGAFFAITRTDTGELLGSISFNRIDWAFRSGEIGYWVASESRRMGIATSALAAVVEWGHRQLDLVEVRVVVDHGNVASLRVAAAIGFEPVGDEDAGELVLVRRPH
jgi:RimJ/RimL family protein N-acetyltransferase